MNALVGDNEIVSNAQLAVLESRFANYKEEFGMNLIRDISNNVDELEITTGRITFLTYEVIKKYIPAIKDEDI